MRVLEVKNKMLIEQNTLYVIAPDKEMFVIDGHIKLTPRRKNHIANLSIDAFFGSVAEKHKETAIGIILSGNANDGTRGLSAIKEAGGLTFAQDGSAKFGSMPKSAIAAGAVDFTLSPKEIALELNRFSKRKTIKKEILVAGKENEIDDNSPDLKNILTLLYKETDVDFSHYKMATIKRRILRRMLLYQVKTLKEYSKLVSEKPDEINILYQDLLINVTGFFRDTEAHHYLKTTLFPKLLKAKGKDETFRIWIPACSTGEEAYSIAMLLQEIQSTRYENIPVKIFATDLSAQAIARARIGEYTKSELEAVSPKRLQRFYTKAGSNYRISKAVRDMCVFTQHNILRDPPFSHVDFISCCNLLIYLDNVAQKKAIATFHYALNPDGYLMFGKSETIGGSANLFTAVNKKLKIYLSKKNAGTRALPELAPHFSTNKFTRSVNTKLLKNESVAGNGFNKAIDDLLLAHYMPAAVVINHAMDILQFRGSTGQYLKHSSGRASLNIIKMIPPEITFELRNAISKAIKIKQAVRKIGIEIKTNTGIRLISIEAIPLVMEWDEPLLLIIFNEPEQVEVFLNHGRSEKNTTQVKDRKIKKLEDELSDSRANLLAFTHEQETLNEELQSTNEEVVSSNEELQSVNEELETSKEEIESSNEELITTNQALQTRNDLLNESYDYSEAIFANMHEPMIILDMNLRVKTANASFYKNFHVTQQQTENAFIYDLGNKQWNIPRLRELLDDIIKKNNHIHDFEVTHNFPQIGKKIMLLNASRVLQKNHGEQLILLAINDITERALLQLKEKELQEKNIAESKTYSLKLEKAVAERTKELAQLNRELAFQNKEKEQRAAELVMANKELAFQNSEKEKKETELIAANKELALQNEEKEKRSAELLTANKELEAFTYIASHDLQEPLRKIQTFAGRIIEKENLSETGQDYFKRMQSAAGRMQLLIEDLLTYSRTNTGESKTEKKDLTLIIEEVKNDLKELIEEKKATIKTKGICEMNIISFQFRQLMHNLIGNALKFASHDRPLQINIICTKQKGSQLKEEKLFADKKYFHISISDNGIGFDPAYKDRIFEVFQKLHSKEEYAGTGIGLAIVKKIVENHGGIITATGILNEGATFDIFFPET